MPQINQAQICLICCYLWVACVTDSCKRLCTQSAQWLQFACSENPAVFHKSKKPKCLMAPDNMLSGAIAQMDYIDIWK